MTSPVYHAESSVRLFGGRVEDYLPIHQWFDESSSHCADCRHRVYRHHTLGIAESVREFGPYLLIVDKGRERRVPVHYIGNQHCLEDMACVPTLQDWIAGMQIKSWMQRGRPVQRRCDLTRTAEVSV